MAFIFKQPDIASMAIIHLTNLYNSLQRSLLKLTTTCIEITAVLFGNWRSFPRYLATRCGFSEKIAMPGKNINRPPPRSREMIEDNLYTAEAVIGERAAKRRKVEYLVKWEGYPVEESTWEPFENISIDLYVDWATRKAEREKARRRFDLQEPSAVASAENTASISIDFSQAARQAYLRMIEIFQESDLDEWERGVW